MNRWGRLDRLLDQAPGDYSLCVWRADGFERYAYQADTVRPAASLIKLAIVGALYDAAAEHGLDLSRRLVLGSADHVAGEGSFDLPAPLERQERAVRSLIKHALIESDNTASNALIRLIGMDAVNRWLAARGCHSTRLQRRFMDFEAAQAGRDNITTARDICRLLLALEHERYAEMRAFMQQTIGDDKLVAGLPAGTPIAHKLGDLPGVEHDAGLIELATGRLAVAALSADLPSSQQGRQTIAAAARLIYRIAIQESE